MQQHQADIGRPLRVIVFGGGPALERGLKQLMCLLDEHPEIELVGAFCQSAGQGVRHVVLDLWRRRRLLAAPLLMAQLAGAVRDWLSRPVEEIRLRRRLARVRSPIRFVPDIHAPEVLADMAQPVPDLGVVYGSPILKPAVFEIPVFGSLGIHHGKVPEYRGKKTTFWAMYNGEPTAGVTIQKIGTGLDTGDVVKQGEVPIGRRWPSSVWSEVEQLGIALFLEAILEVKRGQVKMRPQPQRRGRPYRDPGAAAVLELYRRLVVRTVQGWFGRPARWNPE
jgi:hypothetical protein